jgi:putative peptidoglycan lipid II flippase
MMLKKFASVSGFTLLSRITGFFRDVVIAAMLGSGLLADAYFVAQRLPNHFRAIFGEGAFNSAFVPAYARALGDDGDDAARRFAGEALTLLVMLLIPLSLLAMWQMPFVIDSLAPGFAADPEKYATAITLTRITFPYLLMVSIVTLLSGVLNAHDRFATAAAAPILLNLAILAALGVAFLFPTAAHAAAWGIVLSGALQLALLGWDAHRLGIMPHFARPRLDPAMKRFFAALGPAVIGSAAVQIAIFADTIIASMLPTGGVSAISYADRLYQLPVGLIGIAAGTVLLPEMSRRFAEGQDDQAYAAQNRSMLLTLMLSAPFLVAFLMIPDVIMRGVFMRGYFTASDAAASASVLMAYGIGLIPIVLIRSIVASFHARQDTRTPLYAAFVGIGANVALKLVLFQPLGAPGLALATAIGAWINGGCLLALALRRQWIAPDHGLWRAIIAIGIASLVLALATPSLVGLAQEFSLPYHHWAAILELIITGLSGALIYSVIAAIGWRATRWTFQR